MNELARLEQETIFESCVYVIVHNPFFGFFKAIFNVGTLVATLSFAVSFYSVSCILELL